MPTSIVNKTWGIIAFVYSLSINQTDVISLPPGDVKL